MWYNKRHSWVVIYIIFVLVNAIMLLFMGNVVRIESDEYNVLATAAMFDGLDWSGTVNPFYYGYGQALLYSILFRIFDDGQTLYRTCLFLNVLLVGLIAPITYSITWHRCSRNMVCNSKPFIITAIVVSYPYITLGSKWAWNESTMILLPYVIMYVIYKCFTSKKMIYSVLLAAVMIYGYSTSNRALAYIIALIMMIVLGLGGTQYRLRNVLNIKVFGSVLGVGILASELIKSLIVDRLYGGQIYRNTYTTFYKSILQNIGETNTLIVIVKAIFGQFYYVVMSSFGVFLILFVLWIIKSHTDNTINIKGRRIRDVKPKSDKQNEDYSYINFCPTYFLICILLTVAMSMGNLEFHRIEEAGRLDFYIYGRYVESIVPCFMFSALLFISGVKIYKFRHITLILATLFIIGLLGILLFKGVFDSGAGFAKENIMGISMVGALNWQSTNVNFHSTMIVVLLICGVLLTLLHFRLYKIAAILITATFLANTVYSYKTIIQERSLVEYKVFNDAPLIDTLKFAEGMGTEDVYIYNIKEKVDYLYGNYQLSNKNQSLRHLTDNIRHNLKGNMKVNSIIISRNTCGLYDVDNQLYLIETVGSAAHMIWVYGDELNQSLKDRGINTKTVNDCGINVQEWCTGDSGEILNIPVKVTKGEHSVVLYTDLLYSDYRNISHGRLYVTTDRNTELAGINISDSVYKTLQSDGKIVLNFKITKEYENINIHLDAFEGSFISVDEVQLVRYD